MRQKLFLSIALVFFACVSFAQPSGWLYNLPITVTNTSNNIITHYQMPIIVNTQQFISAGKMQVTGNDIRFGTPCTGTKLYPYYIDSGMNTTATFFYVLIDTIQPGQTLNMFMFFGNNTVAPGSTMTIFNGPFHTTNQTISTPNYAYSNGGSPGSQFGFYFVPNQDLFVTKVGKRVSGVHNQWVNIFDGGGTPVARAQVAGPTNTFNYTTLANPVWLKSGQTYSACVFIASGENYLYAYNVPTFRPEINRQGYAYSWGVSSTTAPNTYSAPSNYDYGWADFEYYTGTILTNPPSYQVGTINSGGVVTNPLNATVCVGQSGTFSASSSGLNQNHQWQRKQGLNWINLSNSANYSGVNSATLTVIGVTTGMNGFKFRDSMWNSCGNGVTAAATLTVNSTSSFVTPAASISGPNPACDNINSLYSITTNVISGSYQWVLNNSIVATTPSYAYHPVNGDQLYAIVTVPVSGAQGCYTFTTAISNLLNLSVGNNFQPVATVVANRTNVCDGTQINFLANSNVVGGTYQWMVNGNNVGQNMPGYSYIPQNGDQVSCTVITPSNGCYNNPSVTAAPIGISTIPNITPVVNLNCPSSAPSGSTVNVSLTMLNSASNYYIFWYKNGIRFDSTTTPNSSFTKGMGTDQILAVLYPQSNDSLGACYATVTTNTIPVSNSTLNVHSLNSNNTIAVNPNPFKQNISVSGLENGDKLALYDISGKQVSEVWTAESNDEQQQFTVNANIAAGTYFLKITDGNNLAKAMVKLQKL
jgi:hypothetical protein